MAATPSAEGPQDSIARVIDDLGRDAPLTCAVCGAKDPRYHGADSINWGKTPDGRDRCPDCAWMQSGPQS